MTLAKKVRDCRYAKGWGPDELASKAEISRTALYQIECGKTELPRAGTLRRIAKALEVPIDDLLGDSGVVAFDLPSFAIESQERGGREHRRGDWKGGMADESAFAADPRAPLSLSHREQELTRKFQEILGSPLGDAVARIVEESHRLIATPRSAATR